MKTKRPMTTMQLISTLEEMKELGLIRPKEPNELVQVFGIALGTFATNMVQPQFFQPKSVIVANYVDEIRKSMPPEGSRLTPYGEAVKKFIAAWDGMFEAYNAAQLLPPKKKLPPGKEK